MGLTWRLLQEVWGHREGFVFLPQKSGARWLETGGYPWSAAQHLPVHFPRSNDVYFSPLVFSEPHRQSQYALPTHVLWSDLDAADPAKCALRPSAAWKTTQGGFSAGHDGHANEDEPQSHWQALWFLGKHGVAGDWWVDEKGERQIAQGVSVTRRDEIPAAEAAALSKRIAYGEPGADRSGWDITQVLRLPGTYNHKHSPPQRVELLWAEKRYYTIAQIEAAYPPVPEKAPVALGWDDVPEQLIQDARNALPIGLQVALERSSAGADRSLELVRLARDLLAFAQPEMVPHLLRLSTLNKFSKRPDERERLLTAVADALIMGSDRR